MVEKNVTYNERNPEHLQIRGQVEGLVGHDPVEVAVHPRDALHGRRAGHERLRVRILQQL